MATALVQDRVDFVQLFLDSGVDLKKFLCVRRLRDLYDDVSLKLCIISWLIFTGPSGLLTNTDYYGFNTDLLITF